MHAQHAIYQHACTTCMPVCMHNMQSTNMHANMHAQHAIYQHACTTCNLPTCMPICMHNMQSTNMHAQHACQYACTTCNLPTCMSVCMHDMQSTNMHAQHVIYQHGRTNCMQSQCVRTCGPSSSPDENKLHVHVRTYTCAHTCTVASHVYS